MNKFIKNQKGFTGVDVVVSIVLLAIFLTVISTVFINIYLSYTNSQRNTVAMSYATQIAELVDKLYYADISDASDSKLNSEIRGLNLNRAYTVTFTVDEHTSQQIDVPLVKVVNITVSYKIGNTTQSVELQKTKIKEMLITPNKPVINTSMNIVPVKFIYTDYTSGLGYWQITSEDDNTWYNYDNKVWATAMAIDNLVVEGDIEVTQSNKTSLVGKKVSIETQISLWIPKFAYSGTNVVFIYSTSEKIVNSGGNLEEKEAGYTISNDFSNNTGFWINRDEIGDNTAASVLQQSKYGR